MKKSPEGTIYSSATKGDLVVADMQWNHLNNVRKKLLKRWASVRVALESTADPITDDNASVDIDRVTADPGALFPVYGCICDELSARSEAFALKEARKLASTENITRI